MTLNELAIESWFNELQRLVEERDRRERLLLWLLREGRNE